MYIDAYRMVWLAAVLIVLVIFFGGPDNHKNLRVKTKQEKWLEAITEKTEAKKDKSSLSQYGITGGSGGGLNSDGQPSVTLPNQQGYYNNQQPGYNSQPGGGGYSPPQQSGYVQSPVSVGQGMPNFQYPATPSTQQNNGSTLPYQTNRYAPQPVPGYVPPSPTPGGAMGQPPGVSPQNNPNNVTYFPQVFPRWNNGPRSSNQTAGAEGPQAAVDTRFFLRGGQQVFSSDASVYVYDENGKPTPMPDGNYIDKDNRSTIMVRDGKRIISN